MTYNIYATYGTAPGSGVAVIGSGNTSPSTYITGSGVSAANNGELAILPDLTKTYVANPEDGTVSVIDNATNTAMTGTGYPIDVGLGSGPIGIVAVAAANGNTYVLVCDYDGPSISVIDPATDTVSSTITSTDGLPSYPAFIAATPDGKTAYVTHQTSPSQISAIDLTGSSPALKSGTGYPITTYLSASLEGIAISPDGTTAYVAANPFEGAVDVIDLTVNPPKVITGLQFPIALPNGALRLAVRPDGKEVWVIGGGSNINVISTASVSLYKTFSVGDDHAGIAFSADSTLAYVTNSHEGGTISVISTEDYTLSYSITFATSDYPNCVAVGQDPPPLTPALFSCSDWFGSSTRG